MFSLTLGHPNRKLMFDESKNLDWVEPTPSTYCSERLQAPMEYGSASRLN
jgi:hypothetical protein